MKRLAIRTLFLLSIFVFFGCASPAGKNARKVAVGMDKADVLELAGNPTRIQRVYGQDRWTYETNNKESSGISTTYVFFGEGRVTHVDSKD